MRNRVGGTRGIIYRLKRGWGQPVAVHYLTSAATDLATGVRQVTRAAHQIPLAVVLPSTAHKEFKYDIGYLRANSNFTYGALWTSAVRQMIVDRGDLPAGFEIKAVDEQYVVFDHKRYAIKKVEDIEAIAYMVTMELTAGVAVSEVHEVFASDFLGYTESFVGGKL